MAPSCWMRRPLYIVGGLVLAVVIVIGEVVIGVRSNQHGRELAVSAALGVVFGLLVISLRLILH